MPETVLVIDDDSGVRTTLEQFLTRYGYDVELSEDGEQGLAALDDSIDLVLLDLNLPGRDGLEIARTVRQNSDVPIIMITGRADEIDRIVGLEIGADDYVAKPFSSRELVARIRAVLKRTRPPEPAESEQDASFDDRFGPWRIDHDRHLLHHDDGRDVRLTYGEYDLLRVFIEHPNRLLSRERLLDLSRNRELEPFDRSVDIQVSRLRRKIEANPRAPAFVLTVRGAGYRFSPAGQG